MPSSIVILGTGSCAPTKIVSNHDLAKVVDTSDEWIVTRTGIRERHIAGQHEPTSELAARAASAAIADARLTAADIDLVVLATVTPDMPMPSTACAVQRKLGISERAMCFDLNAACTGFLYALDVARSLMAAGHHRHALVIGAEKLSSFLDWQDRSTCVLFGDGAGAVVLGQASEPGRGILGCYLGAEGVDPSLLCIPGGGCLHPASAHSVEHRQHYVKMKGREIFKMAVRVMAGAAREILEQHGLTADQITWVIPHQANLRIIETLAKDLALPLDRFIINLDRYGNTSSASIPIALDEARRAGRIHPGEISLLVAFGGGLTYGSALIRW
ncbi:MAG: ketoacyl-ACP synthase III [Opitutaceae bacterium]|nr:ketoacyl-ACP synthase III [Opitutaceae bacterium]